MELTLPARLGSLVAKHRPRIPELLGTLTEQTVLKGRAHHGGHAFGPQGAGSITPILKAIHLFAHHIGALTDATTEQIRRLQERCSNLPKTGTLEVVPRRGLHSLPTLAPPAADPPCP